MARKPFELAGETVTPGTRARIHLPVADLYTKTGVTMPITVIHGKRDGPALFVCGAIHGDEINGVEIIRRLLKLPALKRLRGTLVAAPVVNVFGFANHARYLPDRRDLNRSFPGSNQGSLAARLADLFMREIVSKCTHGIDLHTGAIHRPNFPHIRAFLGDDEILTLAKVFNTPVILDTDLLAGSLREASTAAGAPVLVYEAGEALRYDEPAIRYGVRGIVNVMRHIGMLGQKPSRGRVFESIILRNGQWVRAPESGILQRFVRVGAHVAKGQRLGIVADPFGENEVEVTAEEDGVILGMINIPLVYEGDALFHLGIYGKKTDIQALGEFQEDLINLPSRSDYYEMPKT